MNENADNMAINVSAPRSERDLFLYTLHLADNTLVLAQRNSEWTGHGPVLEQDIAITNIALDLLGQARNFYQYAALLYNNWNDAEKNAVEPYLPRLWKTYGRELQEDDLAFLRDENQYLNLLITELPRGNWAFSVLRQFFFSAFQLLQYQQLQQSSNPQLAAVAEKSIKEILYHVRWSGEWVIRLGDGTEESNSKLNTALDELWMFTGEMFTQASYECINTARLQTKWTEKIEAVFQQATITLPKQAAWQNGGKNGVHTEHMGYLLAEMQYLQRAYPNCVW